jgi:hypothetical protein
MSLMGHEPPRRSFDGAAAMPPKADTKADDWRDGSGPLSAARTRSKNIEFLPSDQREVVADLPIGP